MKRISSIILTILACCMTCNAGDINDDTEVFYRQSHSAVDLNYDSNRKTIDTIVAKLQLLTESDSLFALKCLKFIGTASPEGTVAYNNYLSGAYLIIEHTEALHVIDVNSGNRSKASQDQETNALEVNLRAADEIARQLRLRDMGGIIVVDFIDMAKSEHRQQLLDHMRDIMAKDRARHNILPLSKFGLMQITRQRVRPALDITTEETCPSCFGKGEVQPSLLFTDKLEEKIEYLTQQLEVRKFILYVHPFVEAYIKKGVFSLYGKWRRRFGRGVKVVADESLAYLQYRVIDADGMEILLHEESDMNSAQTKNKTRSERLLEDETSQSQTDQSKKNKEDKQS